MNKNRSLLICFVCMAMLFSALTLSVSAVRPEEARTLKAVYVNDALDGYEMPYTLYLPADYDETKAYPTLLLLHGAGERGNDNELQLFHAVDELYDTRPELMNETIFLIPQCPNDEQWVDWPWTDGNYSTDEIPESKALSTAMKILGEVMNTYACDENRVYIMGISMGGYGAWDALVRHESTFAAGVPLCGGGDASKAELLAQIPIWCVHGTADSAVQFAGTQGMYDAITAAGGERIIFEPKEGMDHNIWDDATTNGELIDWMFAQNLTLRYPPETEAVTEPVAEQGTTDVSADQTPASETAVAPAAIIAVVVIAVIAIGAIAVVTMKKKK